MTASDEGPVLADLLLVGFSVNSIAELRRSGLRYRKAVPVLLDWLKRTSDRRLKEQIVRALSVPWAGPQALRSLIAEFRRIDATVDSTGTGLRWTVGNALEVLFEEDSLDEYLTIVEDRRYGKARQMVVLGVGKSRQPQATIALLGLIDDPDVDGHVVKALGRMRSEIAREALEGKLNDNRPWVRKEARNALKKLQPKDFC